MEQLTFAQHYALGRQHMFDVITKHLLTQMKQSREDIEGFESLPSSSGAGCRYRGPHGLQCAVGCLIADSEYHEGLERTIVEHLDFITEFEDEKLEDFLGRLQRIHDNNIPTQWYAELEKISKYFNLAFNPPA